MHLALPAAENTELNMRDSVSAPTHNLDAFGFCLLSLCTVWWRCVQDMSVRLRCWAYSAGLKEVP